MSKRQLPAPATNIPLDMLPTDVLELMFTNFTKTADILSVGQTSHALRQAVLQYVTPSTSGHIPMDQLAHTMDCKPMECSLRWFLTHCEHPPPLVHHGLVTMKGNEFGKNAWQTLLAILGFGIFDGMSDTHVNTLLGDPINSPGNGMRIILTDRFGTPDSKSNFFVENRQTPLIPVRHAQNGWKDLLQDIGYLSFVAGVPLRICTMYNGFPEDQDPVSLIVELPACTQRLMVRVKNVGGDLVVHYVRGMVVEIECVVLFNPFQ